MDLWPEDIAVPSDAKAPISILREQASLLGEKTNNVIEAEVRRTNLEDARIEGSPFRYGFFLVAPALGKYRYKLFSIEHGPELYPVIIIVEPDIAREMREKKLIAPKNPLSDAPVGIRVTTEESFLRFLKAIFGASKTRKLIQGIQAQASSPPF
jgi:hypothetical protein